MKVFISWSKPLSRDVATALHWWLPQVVQSLDPFISSADIEPGARWSPKIAQQLEETKLGLICVTRENRHEPWLNFEAGALAKKVDDSYVIPLLIDLGPADLEGPLAQFQAVKTLDKDGIKDVLLALNTVADISLDEGRLLNALDVWWPNLDERLAGILRDAGVDQAKEPLRDQRELLEEILGIVRKLGDPSSTRRAERAAMNNQAMLRLLRQAPLTGIDDPGITDIHMDHTTSQVVIFGAKSPTPQARKVLRDIVAPAGYDIKYVVGRGEPVDTDVPDDDVDDPGA